jgi:hypothetical protein
LDMGDFDSSFSLLDEEMCLEEMWTPLARFALWQANQLTWAESNDYYGSFYTWNMIM